MALRLYFSEILWYNIYRINYSEVTIVKRLLTAEQMKRCDSYTIETLGVPSRELMQRAAAAAFREIINGGFDLTRVLCICGTGNNGGDGLAVAMLLRHAGVNVEFYICGDKTKMAKECEYRYYALQTAGVTEQRMLDFGSVTLIVDAILGIGLAGEVREPAASVIGEIEASGVPVVSLDIPSGINSDTGAPMGSAVHARMTVAFSKLKPGHIFYPGRIHCGNTVVTEIGIGDEGIEGDTPVVVIPEKDDIKAMIPERYPDSHKGDFGRLLVVAGCEGMCGAAYFSALGAYRMGVGLVEIFTPKVNLPIIQTKIPEAVATVWEKEPAVLLRERIKKAGACVIGPGLGLSTDAARLVEEALDCPIPLLIDADGLNLIAGSDSLREKLKARKYPTVVTPHQGEMSRLRHVTVEEVYREPIRSAVEFSEEYGVVCVQKSATTVVAKNDFAVMNRTGCTGLSKGGSGDVLSGVIGALLAQGKTDHDAAVAGVYIHGIAGEIASAMATEYSLLATDIANAVGLAIKDILA